MMYSAGKRIAEEKEFNLNSCSDECKQFIYTIFQQIRWFNLDEEKLEVDTIHISIEDAKNFGLDCSFVMISNPIIERYQKVKVFKDAAIKQGHFLISNTINHKCEIIN